ncbi:sulfotransferase family protein [Aureitalea marina]|uniref:Sulfotransferase n=1 Tax=Aureitalea marina TaxID=930804 RepID=A0A2S7KNQ0_9FLAO|nr:sulfotransferase [Aureitalea marina]PQB04230.1 hypothetical protein BST85_04420 [Aureitalea marina]
MSSEQYDIIFIGGIQRSGTTFLRGLLNNHKDVLILYECAFYKLLYNKYSNGIEKDSIGQFLDDLYNIRRFRLLGIDRQILKEKLRQHGGLVPYPKSIRLVLDIYREQNKPEAKVVGLKNPNALFHLKFIHELFPEASFLNMIRDPRGVLGSLKKKRTKRGSYDRREAIWMVYKRFRDVVNIHKNKQLIPIQHILYRDLVSNPESTIREICKFIGIIWSPDLLNSNKSEVLNIPENERWQHGLALEKPNTDRISAYKDELDQAEIAITEYLLKDELDYFGMPQPTYRTTYTTYWEVFKIYTYRLQKSLGVACF